MVARSIRATIKVRRVVGGGLAEARAVEAVATRQVVPVASGSRLAQMSRERGPAAGPKEAARPSRGGVNIQTNRTRRLIVIWRHVAERGAAPSSGEEAMEGANVHGATRTKFAA